MQYAAYLKPLAPCSITCREIWGCWVGGEVEGYHSIPITLVRTALQPIFSSKVSGGKPPRKENANTMTSRILLTAQYKTKIGVECTLSSARSVEPRAMSCSVAFVLPCSNHTRSGRVGYFTPAFRSSPPCNKWRRWRSSKWPVLAASSTTARLDRGIIEDGGV